MIGLTFDLDIIVQGGEGYSFKCGLNLGVISVNGISDNGIIILHQSFSETSVGNISFSVG